MSSLSNRSEGFTLVELLVAAVIGGLFIASISTLVRSHANINQRGRDNASANSFAENKMEALRSAGYLRLSNGTQDVTSELPAELQSPRNASIVVTDNSTSVKKVVLNISYADIGNTKNLSYTTLIGELGVGQY